MTASLEEAYRMLRIAERDLQAFRILAGHPKAALPSMCFHAQQSIEKSLKAVLFAKGVEFRRTHDLYELADRIEQAGVALPCSAEEFALLNPYAVDFRYDDQIIQVLTKEEADYIAGQTLLWAQTVVAASAR